MLQGRIYLLEIVLLLHNDTNCDIVINVLLVRLSMNLLNTTTVKKLPKNLPLLFKEKVQEKPYYPLQLVRMTSGDFKTYNYGKVYQEMIQLALGLEILGVKKYDKVGLIADNRREWLVTDFALLSLGACDVPRGCDSMGKEIRFILSFVEAECSFFENEKQLQKVLEDIHEVPHLKKVILFDAPSKETISFCAENNLQVLTYIEVLDEGKKLYYENPEKYVSYIEGKMETIEKDTLATIIFTSGTTGVPKGVMLSHENYLVQLEIIHNFVTIKGGELWINSLPIWHSYERAFQYVTIATLSGITYSKPVASRILSDMQKVNPRWMCGVPRLWEAMWQIITRDLRKKGDDTYDNFMFYLNASKRFVRNCDRFLGNIASGRKRSRLYDIGVSILPLILLFPLRCVGEFIYFRNLREKLGGKLQVAVSGGGSLHKDIEECYRAIGVNILEAYGMTETAPLLAMKKPSHPYVGCVGEILPCVEIKIVRHNHGIIEDTRPLPQGKKGMICARGKQIMKGYYKRPDLTELVIDSEGWLSTGDVGMLTSKNGLRITGRAKDTIVLYGGENIEPPYIEKALCSSAYIDTAVIFGQDQKYIAALIVPNQELLITFAFEKGISFTEYEELMEKPEIANIIREEIEKAVSAEKGFRTCERVHRFELLPAKFVVGEELSAKQELVRHKIAEKYKGNIKKLFA